MQPVVHGPVAQTYLLLVAALGAISGIVIVEPAPYDVALPILFALGLVAGGLQFQKEAALALSAVAVFLVGNIISTIGIRSPSLVDNARYLAITGYLLLSWAFFVGLFGRFGYQGVRSFFVGYTAGACVAVILVAGALLQASSTLEGFVSAGRAVALFKDPNVFGPFLIPVALYAALRVSIGRSFAGRVAWTLALVLASLGVLLSLSRAAWGSYALGILVYTLLVFRGSRGICRRAAVLGVICLALFLPVWHVAGYEYGDLLVNRVGLQHYDDDRFAIQRQAASMSLTAPEGIGPGQAESTFDYATHSLYLRVLVENGWVSFAALGVFLYASLAKSIAGIRSRIGLRPYYAFCTAALVSLLFNSLFVDTLHWRHFWLVFALPWMAHESVTSYHAR